MKIRQKLSLNYHQISSNMHLISSAASHLNLQCLQTQLLLCLGQGASRVSWLSDANFEIIFQIFSSETYTAGTN